MLLEGKGQRIMISNGNEQPPGKMHGNAVGTIVSTANHLESSGKSNEHGASASVSSFFALASEYALFMRSVFEEASGASDIEARQSALSNVQLAVHTLATSAKQHQLSVTGTIGTALAALLKRLAQNPKTVNSSTLNTVSKALDLLERVCVPGVEESLQNFPPIQILVVDDEPLARRTVVGTLELAFGKPDNADHGAKALVRASQKAYDIIFTDIEMPMMDGYEFCRNVRAEGPNRNVPIAFITTHIDAASRDAAARNGGTDFIAKPFLPVEITVKALTLAWDKRLREITESPRGPGGNGA